MKVKKLKEERQKKVENEEKALQKLFKPQIDARSTKMAERKGITRKDVTERMLQDLNEREKKAQVAKKREVESKLTLLLHCLHFFSFFSPKN